MNSIGESDESTDDCKFVKKVLQTLTLQFDHIMVTIEESKDFEALTVEELQNFLEAHEQWVIERKNIEKIVESLSSYN